MPFLAHHQWEWRKVWLCIAFRFFSTLWHIIWICLAGYCHDCAKYLEWSSPNWDNLQPSLDRPDNFFYRLENSLDRRRIVQKCLQECKPNLYQPIRCYQGPFQSVWCFNRMVLTTGARVGWYQQTAKSVDDSFNWNRQSPLNLSSLDPNHILCIFSHIYWVAHNFKITHWSLSN